MAHSKELQPTRTSFSFVEQNTKLPPEIIAQIFFLVCTVQTNICPARIDVDHPDRDGCPFSKEPVILSHVCSRWRQIAVSLPSLWSHIDVFPERSDDPRLCERLEIYTTRSAQALLDVHMIVPYLTSTPDSIDTEKFPLFATIGPRIQSFTVQSACGISSGIFCGAAITACFAKCTPGILTQVSIQTVVASNWDPVINAQIDYARITESALEDLCLRITVLRLELFWINWRSKAFRGLTELRLSCSLPVGPSELESILLLSPGLRVLELDDPDDDEFLYDDSPPTPIHLDDLEILSLSWVRDRYLGSILRLIVPGTKPLSLSIMNPYHGGSRFTSKTELQHFITRSNVTRLCTHHFESDSRLVEVLGLVPNIRVLAVDQFKCNSVDGEAILSPIPTLDALYIVNSSESHPFTWPSIETFVKRHNVQKLTLWKYDFRFCGIGEPERMPNNLYTICPIVKLVSDGELNPIEEWC